MLTVPQLACQVMGLVLGAAAIQPAEPHTLTEVCRYTFDRNADLDYDGYPDDWNRRRGAAFPHYVHAAIDPTVGADDTSSLRIDANAAPAVYYSPLIPIDDLHTYYFRGYVRTENLQHDAGIISISLLDHRRQRVQRVLSRPVTGQHAEWVTIDIGPITPADGVRFAVLGCHLVPGPSDRHDIGGRVWFDNLSLGRLPRMELESNFYRHFVSGESPVELHCKVSGLDPGYQYHLDFVFQDVDGNVLDTVRLPLEEDEVVADRQTVEFLEPRPVTWTLEPKPPGFYSAVATLVRDELPIASQGTTLVILQLIDTPRVAGEFGWSLPIPLKGRELTELPRIASQAGINSLKFPIWQLAEVADVEVANAVAAMFDRLIASKIAPVALLSEPAPALRQKFAKDWHGANEVFSLAPEIWESSLEPVIARFSSTVREWQLGGELDRSFLGATFLSQTVQQARQRIQRISLHAELGLPWDWKAAPPSGNLQFVSLPVDGSTTPAGLQSQLQRAAFPGVSRWVLLRLSQLPGDTLTEQAAALAKLMLAARLGRADRIFLDDVYHDQWGLLHTDGSPRKMFIPWRTVALQLQGTEHLGQMEFPGRSSNAVFAKDGAALVVIWNDSPATESLYLGPRPMQMDLWGRITPLPIDPASGEARVEVDSTPKFLIHCSEPLARWRIAAQYELGRMASEYGGHDEALLITNTFPQGISGDLALVLPSEWEVEPRSWTLAAEAGESLRLPCHIRLPTNANLGEVMTYWDFRVIADRPYRFRVYRPYIIGLDDLTIEVIDRRLADGRLEIEQVVTNRTEPLEKLDFRCSLFVPDARRQKLQITKLGHGTDRKLYYLPDAEQFKGRELWLRLEQDGGRRVLNYKWEVGKSW